MGKLYGHAYMDNAGAHPIKVYILIYFFPFHFYCFMPSVGICLSTDIFYFFPC